MSIPPTNSSVRPCPSCGTRNRVPAVAAGTPHCASCHIPLPWLVAATDRDFSRVVDTNVPVLVDLWAPWCGPCRTIAPILEQAAADHAGRLKVVKVNVDESPGVSARFGVQGIPTLLLLRNGREVSRRVGALPARARKAWLDTETAAPSPARR